MAGVATLGEILVEVMALDKGRGFPGPVRLLGPYPSGAPAIFIDQVAKLGQPCGIVGSVGDDDFGRLNLGRLQADGVDVSAVEVLPGEVTGSAFVRYRDDGERDFVFNISRSASGRLRLGGRATEVLGQCRHLHVSGSTLFSQGMAEVVQRAVSLAKAEGATVSFDPNVRSDLASDEGAGAVRRRLLQSCDIFLPSGAELTALTHAKSTEGAVAEILGLGVKCIVVKDGPRGSTFYGSAERVSAPGYEVDEVDATGAGDCFAATFVTCWLAGRDIAECLDYANCAGALAVCARGPMEGTSTFAELDELRARGPRRPERRLDAFLAIAGEKTSAQVAGITSVCSSHPLVVEAAILQAAEDGAPVLIEATCNQVNHQEGYSGLTPVAFRDLVLGVADRLGFPRQRVLLGGDHLGPSPWRKLPAEAAMAEAEAMVEAYVAAGYRKIHLDATMGCRDEPELLADWLSADRAGRLARAAEQAASASGLAPYYVIGTEVPPPGGARHDIDQVRLTSPASVGATLEAHHNAFAAAGAQAAFDRVIAVVVQPGVEFDNNKFVVYDPEAAHELSRSLARWPGLVFEAHSTDYQPPWSLAQLVHDGFAILKVGPALTFALREALYGLDHIAAALDPQWGEQSVMATMENEMLARPGYWEPYYPGEPSVQRLLRHFSYSDRARYYWASPGAQAAVDRLFALLDSTGIPAPLVSQYLPTLYDRVANGSLAPEARALAVEAVRDVLRLYAVACRQAGPLP